MRLDQISAGDLILARIKGRSIYGEVIEVDGGLVQFRPLCPAAGWRHAAARDVVTHWRKAGLRKTRRPDDPKDEQSPSASVQLGLPIGP